MKPENLHPLIKAIVAGHATDREVAMVVRHAAHIAFVRLGQLLRSGRFHLDSFSISLEGTALDCIAELFERDEQGSYVELQSVFTREYDIATIDPFQSYYRLRSVVFVLVQKGIIRLYKEHDPLYSRILRNVRLAIKSSHSLVIFERLGIMYVALARQTDRMEHLPELTINEMDSLLTGQLHGYISTPNFLKGCFAVFQSVPNHRLFYSVFDIAVLIKLHMVREHIPLERLVSEEPNSLAHDISGILCESLALVEKRFAAEYVNRGKIDSTLFSLYMKAIQELVRDVYERNNGHDMAHPDYLLAFMPGLSREEYRKTHRTHFEYMVRVAKKSAGDRLSELL